LNKVNKPVDRNEWGMTPQTVNAYYDPTSNEIAFPAAILQVGWCLAMTTT
jgi:putative endopeptidase